jgi:hypothetical protein
MSADIFKFWAEIEAGAMKHPADAAVLARVDHGLDLKCLPAAFAGPLRTAPIVLLYLSFGLHEMDRVEARSDEGRARYMRMRKGYEPLPGPDEHLTGHRWWSSRTRAFGDWEDLRDQVAVLNICAYHSRTFRDYGLLAALPSSRVSLGWAQSVLFRQAEAGERVVICLRASKYWGLKAGRKYGRSLFAPEVTRSGFMKSSVSVRGAAIKAARRIAETFRK